jgi:hypothetical protein
LYTFQIHFVYRVLYSYWLKNVCTWQISLYKKCTSSTDSTVKIGPSWSYGSLIYHYLCNKCQLWVGIWLMARCARYNIMW